jgi:hypothetical protein
LISFGLEHHLIISHYSFKIFLDCDALMRPSSRASFSQLINEITAELVEKHANETGKTDCSPRLGLK